jgi:hypothetical protein
MRCLHTHRAWTRFPGFDSVTGTVEATLSDVLIIAHVEGHVSNDLTMVVEQDAIGVIAHTMVSLAMETI